MNSGNGMPHPGMMGGGQTNEGMTQSVKIDPNDLEDILCPNCGGKIFFTPGSVVGLKKISQFISQSGKEEVIAYQATVCVKCQTILEESMGDEPG